MSSVPPGWDPIGLFMKRQISLPSEVLADAYRTPVKMNIEEPSMNLAERYRQITATKINPIRNKKLQELVGHAMTKAKKAALKGKSYIQYKMPWYFTVLKWDAATQRYLVKELIKEGFVCVNFANHKINEYDDFNYPEYPIKICW